MKSTSIRYKECVFYLNLFFLPYFKKIINIEVKIKIILISSFFLKKLVLPLHRTLQLDLSWLPFKHVTYTKNTTL